VSHPLLVSASSIGAPSETFIRRHMVDLVPGRTAIMVRSMDPPGGRYWDVPGPVLALDLITHDFTGTVRRFLVEHGVQVFLGEYLDHSLRWLDLARELGIRFFAHAHGYDVSERLRDERMRAAYLDYRRADGLVSVTRAGRDRLVELGLDPSLIHVIPCGVDVPADLPVRDRQGPVRCIAVSRMIAVKGPILALEAFRRALEACPNLQLDFVGAGPLSPAVRQFVRAFDLDEKIVLHGVLPHDRVLELMARADLFMQHSLLDPETGAIEGLPVAMLEAMSRGLPVVATRHGGIPEAVSDGLTGFLVDEGDTSAMARHIVSLVRDRQLRLRLGAAAWRTARERFSWPAEREGLLRVLGLNENPRADSPGSRIPQPPAVAPSPEERGRLAPGQPAARLVADPNPIAGTDGTGLGATTLAWHAPGARVIEIRVDAPDGPLFCRGGSSGTGTTGKWVRNGMAFFLQDVSESQPLTEEHTLAATTLYVRRNP
jgi:glycosyltransferase involved in cell wall biosynthesis